MYVWLRALVSIWRFYGKNQCNLINNRSRINRLWLFRSYRRRDSDSNWTIRDLPLHFQQIKYNFSSVLIIHRNLSEARTKYYYDRK